MPPERWGKHSTAWAGHGQSCTDWSGGMWDTGHQCCWYVGYPSPV